MPNKYGSRRGLRQPTVPTCLKEPSADEPYQSGCLGNHENRDKGADPLAIRRARQHPLPEYVQRKHPTDDLEDETHVVRLAVP